MTTKLVGPAFEGTNIRQEAPRYKISFRESYDFNRYKINTKRHCDEVKALMTMIPYEYMERHSYIQTILLSMELIMSLL